MSDLRESINGVTVGILRVEPLNKSDQVLMHECVHVPAHGSELLREYIRDFHVVQPHLPGRLIVRDLRLLARVERERAELGAVVRPYQDIL